MYIWDDKDISILDIREKERQRIAMEIHDVSIQHLIYLMHKVELCSLYIDKDPEKAKVELSLVDKEFHNVIDGMRRMIFNLCPIPFSIDDIELKDKLDRMIERLKRENNFNIEADIENVPCESKTLSISIYRIINECCNNAIKHSRGDRIKVSLKVKNDKYIIKVFDNGVGFDKKTYEDKIIDNYEGHFGFLIMKERIQLLNGKMDFKSSNKGTIFTFEIPVNHSIS